MSTPPREVRLAILGLGHIGTEHLETVRRLPGVRVVALSDLDLARLTAARASSATPVRTFEQWRAMLELPDLDALLVCTPPMHHVAPAVAAMEKGIHVFIEKPLARRGEDAQAIVKAAKKTGVVCAIGYQWRAIDFLDDLRAELNGQRIGLLASQSIGAAYPRPWFVDWKQGGGILFELASHDIDLQRAIAGDVVQVQAASTNVPISDDPLPGFQTVLSIALRFASGALGTIALACCTRSVVPSWGLEIVSTRGGFRLKLDPHFSMTAVSNGHEITSRAQRLPTEANLSRFLEAVRRSDPGFVFCGPEEGARTLAVVLACEKALVTGTTVQVTGLDNA